MSGNFHFGLVLDVLVRPWVYHSGLLPKLAVVRSRIEFS